MKSAGVEGEMEIERCQLWAGRLGWRVFQGFCPGVYKGTSELSLYQVLRSRFDWFVYFKY